MRCSTGEMRSKGKMRKRERRKRKPNQEGVTEGASPQAHTWKEGSAEALRVRD